jgi:hypothetical protein
MAGIWSTGAVGTDVFTKSGSDGSVEGIIVGVLTIALVAVAGTDVSVGLAVEAMASQAIDKTISKGRMIRILRFILGILLEI